MNEQHSLLSVKGITKDYPGVPTPTRVLAGVDLSVVSRESAAIIGPSGCGKSTLLNIIGTLDVPDSGSVTFDGQDVLKLTDKERAAFRNQAIGFVFQSHHLLPQCTAIENVLAPTLVNRNAEQSSERAVRLMERVGLGDRLKSYPGELSGGERQRVAVARALINQPRLLLADEPTGSLSRDGAEALSQLLLELNREEGITLIVVTHAMDVAKMMERILELRNGTLCPYTRNDA